MNRHQRPRAIGKPEPCYVEMRLVKGGPLVGARIYACLGMLHGEINGFPCEPERVWHSGELIDEERYRYLIAQEPEQPDTFVPPRKRPLPF
jgi:hypothetical protein